MTETDLPGDTKPKLGFHKVVMGAVTIYSVAAIFQIATRGPNPYEPDTPFALNIAAAFFVISFTCAMSQLALLYRIELIDRQKEYLEAFRKSSHFSVVFIASLIASFLGTCALLINYAFWLLIPLILSTIFTIWFLNWQEAELTPGKQIHLEQDNSPIEDKD